MNMNIHRVVSVEISPIETNEIQSGQYSTRKIVIKNDDGHSVELVLFAEDAKSLEVTL